MPILYDRLQVPQDSAIEQIERSYRALAYMHMKQGDKSKMVDLNNSYSILRDPYKRSFYDRYGDEYMQPLLNSTESFFLTRMLAPGNVYCLLGYAYMNIINFFFLGLIYKAFEKHTIFRYILFISSPVLLAVVAINTGRHFHFRDRNMTRLNLCVFMSIFNSISIAILALGLEALYLVLAEAAANTYLLVYRRFGAEAGSGLQRFALIKSALTCLYCFEPYQLHYFIPCFVCLGMCVFNGLVGVALSMTLFPMCLSIFLSEATDYTVLPNAIHAVHGILGCLCLFKLSSAVHRLFTRGSSNFRPHRLAICGSASAASSGLTEIKCV